MLNKLSGPVSSIHNIFIHNIFIHNILISILLITSVAYGEISIVCPSKAPTGSPVSISYKGIPEGAAVKIIKEGFTESDTFLELFDANGKPVTLFWSLEPGPRKIQLIVCDHTDPIQAVTHVLDYGPKKPDPEPEPGPKPEPDDLTKSKVQPLVSYCVATTMEDKDLKLLAEFYSDFATELLKSQIKDTGTFRAAYVDAGRKFFANTNINDKYDGLSDVVDLILANALTRNIVPLNKVEAAKLLKGISWAFTQGVN